MRLTTPVILSLTTPVILSAAKDLALELEDYQQLSPDPSLRCATFRRRPELVEGMTEGTREVNYYRLKAVALGSGCKPAKDRQLCENRHLEALYLGVRCIA